MLRAYGQGAYALRIKTVERKIEETLKRVNEKMGVKETDTGLAPPHQWDLEADRMRAQEQGTLQVARCTKIITKPTDGGVNGLDSVDSGAGLEPFPGPMGANSASNGEASSDQPHYVISVKQIGKFVVGLGKKVTASDIEEGMRIGYCSSLWLIETVVSTAKSTKFNCRCPPRSTRLSR